jgi:hypothetical protein
MFSSSVKNLKKLFFFFLKKKKKKSNKSSKLRFGISLKYEAFSKKLFQALFIVKSYTFHCNLKQEFSKGWLIGFLFPSFKFE